MTVLRNIKCFFAWLFAVCLSVIFRTFQILKLTEYETGFIKSSHFGTAVILFVLFVLLTVAAALFVAVSADKPQKSRAYFRISSVFSLALGVSAAVSSIKDTYVGVPAFLRIICICFGFLSAVFFVCFAIRPIIHFPFSSKLTVIPLLFILVKSAVIFIKSSYHTLTNDTLYEVGSYCLLMLLFLELSRNANNSGDKVSIKKFSAVCSAASSFLICASLPKIIVVIFSPFALPYGIKDSVLLLFSGLFAASLLFTRVSFSGNGLKGGGRHYSGKHSE